MLVTATLTEDRMPKGSTSWKRKMPFSSSISSSRSLTDDETMGYHATDVMPSCTLPSALDTNINDSTDTPPRATIQPKRKRVHFGGADEIHEISSYRRLAHLWWSPHELRNLAYSSHLLYARSTDVQTYSTAYAKAYRDFRCYKHTAHTDDYIHGIVQGFAAGYQGMERIGGTGRRRSNGDGSNKNDSDNGSSLEVDHRTDHHRHRRQNVRHVIQGIVLAYESAVKAYRRAGTAPATSPHEFVRDLSESLTEQSLQWAIAMGQAAHFAASCE